MLRPAYTNDDRAPLDNVPLQLGEGAAGLAMLRRETVVVTDYTRWENGLDSFKQRQLQAVEAVPLLVADRAIGALVVRFYKPHAVSAQEEEILALLAAQVAPGQAVRVDTTASALSTTTVLRTRDGSTIIGRVVHESAVACLAGAELGRNRSHDQRRWIARHDRDARIHGAGAARSGRSRHETH